MSDFNNDDYLKGQVIKQIRQKKMTSYQVKLESTDYKLDKDLLDETLFSLQNRVKKGELTYEEILKFYLNRIHDNQDLNALICINKHAVNEARQKVYDDKHSLLYGIPVLVKDNISTKDMPTTGGAVALENLQTEDAEIIRLLKEAGAIILGKANLSEWANFMSTESSNGYSALGGQTMNPYGSFDVGGSSSGSAVAVASQLAPLAIGTETAGSIIYPASQNGIVGLKPTLGLISQDKIIPISKSHDTAGPMARSVKEIYELLKCMTMIQLRKPVFNERAFKNKKVGLIVNNEVTTYYREGDDLIINEAIRHLESIGAEVKEIKLDDRAFDTKVYDILKYEFRLGVKSFLQGLKTDIKNLGDVIKFNQKDMDALAPFNHEIIKQAYLEYFDPDEINSQTEQNRNFTRQSLDKALEDVDILMTLSNYSTSVYAPAGYPAICLPASYRASGEPVGITFIASAHEDIKLLELSYAFEKCITRKNPRRLT
ncbi:hypothetical protein EZV73_08405 [Acidaminobacter sp. JC074]|uniref:amidase family protein n=1 Tax=Acidaminobacter sp. JC074 TaxID=2530199 RepID=UPI001F0E0D75|nr:amidase family protein [Acidaminobacter sp. JC074]MCH4887591.1 hypothetical protein [Acidaminobacter sp. JC074]